MPKIFICYRRIDSNWPAQIIYKELVLHFGYESVIFDIDTIPLGKDFREYIHNQVSQCDILLAVIGDHWLTTLEQRLYDPEDFVRIEIQTALEKNIPIVPILVGNESVPSKKKLPPELVDLAYKQGTLVRTGPDLQNHLNRLKNGLDRLFAEHKAEEELNKWKIEEKRKREAEDEVKAITPHPSDITSVLRERERLEQLLEQRFRKKQSIIITDIDNFIQYMLEYGDTKGRVWIQKHHDIVIPLIVKYNGVVLDVMGDGVMASFPDTFSAAKASISIQKSLYQHNAKTKKTERTHVRIGINSGEVIADKKHVVGDVVNVAARIQALADADQILISKNAYEDIIESNDILCEFHKSSRIKGKPEAIELYRIIWK